MKTYALVSQKGGTGKSTLARQLAVRAGEDGRSLLVDRDPQRTCEKWWKRRQEAANPPELPELLDLGAKSVAEAVAILERKKGSLFIDTRPAVGEPEAAAARAADVVLVPVKPSLDDIEAIEGTLDMLGRLQIKPLVIVNLAKSAARAQDAHTNLLHRGVRVCPHFLRDRAVYVDALLDGRAGHELKGPAARAAAEDINNIWQWIRSQRV